MLAEFVEKIREVVRDGNKVSTLEVAGFPRKVIVQHGNTHEWRDKEAPRCGHMMYSLGDLLDFASRYENAVVFHNHTEIDVVLDDSDRRERVYMPLTKSERFALLERMSNGGLCVTPSDAVKLIRFDLHGAGADTLIAGLRKVDFTRKGTGHSTTEHGRESLGKSVEVAVQQSDQIPTEFVASVPIYANEGLRTVLANIRVGVYLDVQNERITLKPLADEVVSALLGAQAVIHGLIVGQVPGKQVFNGAAKFLDA